MRCSVNGDDSGNVIVINVTEYESRIAILEDGKLVELLVERPEHERIVGNIYKGKVASVLPGLQAAFIDIGMEKNAFLHYSDVGDFEGEGDLLIDWEADEGEDDDDPESKPYRKKRRHHRRIGDLFKKDQEVLVQLIKEPIGDKGPKITTDVSIPGRYVVLVPGSSGVGISRKVSNWGEKRRLRKIVSKLTPDGFGVIIRTVGEGKTEKQFRADINFLLRIWGKIAKRVEKFPAPLLLHRDMEMTSSLIRDLLGPAIDRVVVDSKKEYRNIRHYLKMVAPNLLNKVELYDDKVPIFDVFDIEPQIEKMLSRKVWIKKGAYIVIDQTEALVTIDVNTGKFVGRRDSETTLLNTNLEAAREVARQIRLRDIGGIIIVDFIDMERHENRRKLFDEFRKELRKDRSKTYITQVSDLGLIEMTRQRVRPSLMHTFSVPCPHCDGIGRVLSNETVAIKIERWFKRAKVASEYHDYQLVVYPTVAELLIGENGSRLNRLAGKLNFHIDLIQDTTIHPANFKVISEKNGVDITNRFAPA
ncbi:MAG: Rne/Rng family ribonuclease [candidate division Zixibacteria bacterium]|nr:Rne/Rng family ribonuclease [candidate division Zixibacteria bacterium]